jgi:hypothetical protein
MDNDFEDDDTPVLEYEVLSEEKANGGTVKYICDVTRKDGTRVLVDTDGNIVFKALETDTPSGKALKREHVDGNEKDLISSEKKQKQSKKYFSKAEVFEKIFDDNSGINIAKACEIFNLTQNIMKNEEKSEITDDMIQKAYDTLGIGKEDEEETIEKAKTDEDDEEDELKKSKKSKKLKKEGNEEDEEDEDDAEEGDDEDDEDDEDEPEYEDEEEEKKTIKKAQDRDNDIDEDEKDRDEEDEDDDVEEEEVPKKKIKKCVTSKIKKALDSDEQEETIIEKAINSLNEKNDLKFQAIATILKDMDQRIERKFEELEEAPARGGKAIRKAMERFPENQEATKESKNTYSISKQRAQVLSILDSATFEKGVIDDGFAKAMTLFESAGQLPADIVNRLKLEKGITLVQ